MDIVRHLQSLCGEGETALVGELTANGARMVLPSAPRPEGRAWYVANGAFIVDRFPNGRPVRQKRCVERVLFALIDDVGGKYPIPKLAPSWIIETSTGNYQYGYILQGFVGKGEYAAAMRAIAAAGHTDPGAVDCVRLARIPGSVNLKPGRDNFVSRLHAWDPDRAFTLADLCKEFGVTPGETEASTAFIRLDDTGEDSVLAWLNESNLVLGTLNGEGWVDIMCPQWDQHTDTSKPAARYHPVDHGFHCFHGCCEKLGTAEFLAWVASEGGPNETPGVSADAVGARMRDAYAKAFPDGPPPPTVETKRDEQERLDKADWFARYAYLVSDDCYFDLRTRSVVSRRAFDAIYRGVLCTSPISKKRVEASKWFDENRQAMNAKVLDGLTYAPGDGMVVFNEMGQSFGNKWADARVATATGLDASPWLAHLARLIPEVEDREHVLDVLAYKLQNPRVKINHAVLMAGDEGTGKDTLFAPFFYALGGVRHENKAVVDAEQITSQWGYGLECEVLILNELRDPNISQRRAMANKLKAIIAAPPLTLTVNKKNMHPYEVANRMLVIAFSNETTPISISRQDRRWFVVRNTVAPLPERDAVALWSWYARGGNDAVASYLQLRDVSRFNPAARPRMTGAKEELIDTSRPMAESWVLEEITARRGPFARGIISSPFTGLLAGLHVAAPPQAKIYLDTLFHALRDAGWTNHGRVKSKEYQAPKLVWTAPGVEITSKSELRRAAEDQSGEKVITFPPAKGR
jgi:hypothetical protein